MLKRWPGKRGMTSMLVFARTLKTRMRGKGSRMMTRTCMMESIQLGRYWSHAIHILECEAHRRRAEKRLGRQRAPVTAVRSMLALQMEVGVPVAESSMVAQAWVLRQGEDKFGVRDSLAIHSLLSGRLVALVHGGQ